MGGWVDLRTERRKKYGSNWNNGLYFWAWCPWENYYTGKTTQRIGCPERKSRIWEKLNETPLAQMKERE